MSARVELDGHDPGAVIAGAVEAMSAPIDDDAEQVDTTGWGEIHSASPWRVVPMIRHDLKRPALMLRIAPSRRPSLGRWYESVSFIGVEGCKEGDAILVDDEQARLFVSPDGTQAAFKPKTYGPCDRVPT